LNFLNTYKPHRIRTVTLQSDFFDFKSEGAGLRVFGYRPPSSISFLSTILRAILFEPVIELDAQSTNGTILLTLTSGLRTFNFFTFLPTMSILNSVFI
jgi:hypothetical protein